MHLCFPLICISLFFPLLANNFASSVTEIKVGWYFNIWIGLCVKGIIQPLLTLHRLKSHFKFESTNLFKRLLLFYLLWYNWGRALVSSSTQTEVSEDWSPNGTGNTKLNVRYTAVQSANLSAWFEKKGNVELQKLALKLCLQFSRKPIQLQLLNDHLKSFAADSTE